MDIASDSSTDISSVEPSIEEEMNRSMETLNLRSALQDAKLAHLDLKLAIQGTTLALQNLKVSLQNARLARLETRLALQDAKLALQDVRVVGLRRVASWLLQPQLYDFICLHFKQCVGAKKNDDFRTLLRECTLHEIGGVKRETWWLIVDALGVDGVADPISKAVLRYAVQDSTLPKCVVDALLHLLDQ